jgi:hypothetical protein
LARETGELVALSSGQPGLDTILTCFYPSGEKFMTTLVWFLTQRSSAETAVAAIMAARRKRFYRDEPTKVIPLALARDLRTVG